MQESVFEKMKNKTNWASKIPAQNLFVFMINEGITLSREQLLDGVWGYDYFGEARTVDTHVKQLRGKLGEYAHCIATIHRVGYRFEVE